VVGNGGILCELCGESDTTFHAVTSFPRPDSLVWFDLFESDILGPIAPYTVAALFEFEIFLSSKRVRGLEPSRIAAQPSVQYHPTMNLADSEARI